jgi:hypothetical protein
MINRANIRGNGVQISWYLTALNENDHVEILEVDGRENADAAYLDQVIMSMQFNSELTKSDKAYFNVQINPAYGEDKLMTREDWYLAADIIAKETGYENQRRVIVLHTKKDRTHAHVVWERYNHETGKMIDNKHSVLKVDRARPKIEEALGHKQTPRRNPQRPELKTALTKIWNDTNAGPEFLKAALKAGYMVAAGTGNRPFMVVDENGRSFDLVRQLEKVKTKDVRARLRNEKLVTDKEAIDLMKQHKDNSGKDGKTQQKAGLQTLQNKIGEFKDTGRALTKETAEKLNQKRKRSVAIEFNANQSDLIKAAPVIRDKIKSEIAFRAMADNGKTIVEDEAETVVKRNNELMRKYLQAKEEKLRKEQDALKWLQELFEEEEEYREKQKKRGFQR